MLSVLQRLIREHDMCAGAGLMTREGVMHPHRPLQMPFKRLRAPHPLLRSCCARFRRSSGNAKLCRYLLPALFQGSSLPYRAFLQETAAVKLYESPLIMQPMSVDWHRVIEGEMP